MPSTFILEHSSTTPQAHGYATHEFEVTVERLGVYLPTEHIDNPKGPSYHICLYVTNPSTFRLRRR